MFVRAPSQTLSSPPNTNIFHSTLPPVIHLPYLLDLLDPLDLFDFLPHLLFPFPQFFSLTILTNFFSSSAHLIYFFFLSNETIFSQSNPHTSFFSLRISLFLIFSPTQFFLDLGLVKSYPESIDA